MGRGLRQAEHLFLSYTARSIRSREKEHDSTALHTKITDGNESHAVRAASTGREPLGRLVAESVAHAPEAGNGGE